MAEVKSDYGFPLFSKDKRPVYFNNNKILTADIWAFWDYAIKAKSKTNERKMILSSLLEQSKMFYKAAEDSELRSKPLLYYYSFLNFAKLVIEMSGKEITKTQRFDHGIEVEDASQTHFHNAKVNIKKFNSGEATPKKRSVCYEFMEIVEPTIHHSFPPPLELNIKEMLKQNVGVHRIFSNIYGGEEHFFKLKNPKLRKNGKDLIFESEVDIDKKKMPSLQAIYGSSITTEKKKATFDGVEKEIDTFIYRQSITMPNYSVTQSQYLLLSQKIREAGIWYFLSKDGYTIYLSARADYRYSPEFIIYTIMFFLGSITRYHPYLFDDILDKDDQWIVSEFLGTQPKQFLYLTTSKVFGLELREPYAKF